MRRVDDTAPVTTAGAFASGRSRTCGKPGNSPHHDPRAGAAGSAPRDPAAHSPSVRADGVRRMFSFDERIRPARIRTRRGSSQRGSTRHAGSLATWVQVSRPSRRGSSSLRRPVTINTELLVRLWLADRARPTAARDGELSDGSEGARRGAAAFLHVPLEHFLATPRARGRRGLGAALTE